MFHSQGVCAKVFFDFTVEYGKGDFSEAWHKNGARGHF